MFKIISFLAACIIFICLFSTKGFSDSYPACSEAPTCNKKADLGNSRISQDKKNVEFCVLDDNGNFAWSAQRGNLGA